ncbi:MAG: ABC transporter permease [Bacteroidota bacterium]
MKLFIRTFKKHLFINLINIFGLTVAITLALCSVTYIINELNFETHFSKADRIFRVTYRFNNSDYDIHWARMNQTWVNEFPSVFPEVEELIRFQSFRPRNILVDGQKFREEFAYAVDSEIFSVFNFEFIRGDPESALNKPNSVVLTQATALKYFGKDNPMGRTITILDQERKEDYQVTGIIQDPPAQSHLPITFLSSINSEEERVGWAYTYILIKENSSIDDLEKKIPAFISQNDPENEEYLSVSFQPLNNIHLHSDLSREIVPNGSYDYVILFLIVTILLVVVAGINFANLNTLKSVNQSKSWGIKQLIGANNHRIKVDVLLESFLTTLLSIVLSVLLLLTVFNKLEEVIGNDLRIYWSHTLLFLVLTALIITILSGFYPIQLVAKLKPVFALTGKVGNQFQGTQLRKILLGLQFIIVMGLLSSTIIVNRQFNYIINRDLGFEKDNLLAIRDFQSPLNNSYETLKTKLIQIPGVEEVTAVMELPTVAIKDEGQVRVKGQPVDDTKTADIQVMDINGLEVLGLELIAGRKLSEDLKSVQAKANQDFMEFLQTKRREYLLNESALKALGWSDVSEALNQEINWSIGGLTLGFGPVVGVVKDFHQEGLKTAIDPTIFTYEPIWLQNVIIKTKTDNVKQLRQDIELAWNQIFPEHPFVLSFMDEEVEKTYQAEQKQKLLMSIFTISSIIIAFLGLFGLISFIVEKRLKELAIHKVMGASFHNMVSLLAKDYLKLILISFIIATPLIWYFGNSWLESYAYHIEINGLCFGISTVLLFICLLSVIYIQVLRIGVANLIKVLKAD